MIGDIDKRIERALAKTRLAFRGVMNLVNAAAHVQFVNLEGFAGEPLPDQEMFQHYGFTSNPPSGTMCIVLPIGGKTAHGIIIATEHGSYRLKGLQSGETALYTDEGDNLVLKRGHIMEANTETFRVNASTAIELNTPIVKASADIKASGDVFDHDTKSMSGMRGAFNGHHHNTADGLSDLPDRSM